MSAVFDDGGVRIPAEYLEIIEAGADYAHLLDSRAYKRLLDFLEKRANEKLVALRESLSSDDRLNNNMRLVWREAEDVLRDIQIEVQRRVSEREVLIKEIGNSGFDAMIDTMNFE